MSDPRSGQFGKPSVFTAEEMENVIVMAERAQRANDVMLKAIRNILHGDVPKTPGFGGLSRTPAADIRDYLRQVLELLAVDAPTEGGVQ